MERWSGKVAVVTGTSRGIGKVIAKTLVDNGMKVVGLARNVDSITQIEGKYYAMKTDLRKEADIVNAFKWILDTLGPVHVLINNAALCHMSKLLDGLSDVWKDVFDINVIGLSIATREAVKQMQEHGIDGHIIHINSIVGHEVWTKPPINVYPASKFSVTALTEILRQELQAIKSKIKITSISPGPTKTEAFGDFVSNGTVLESQDVADAACYVLGTPPHVQVHELTLGPVHYTFRP